MPRAAEALAGHLRYAIRAFRRTPGFTIAVVLTLALGIGANSAVFSALDAVVLRPLPFPDADRLVRLRQVQERSAESNIAPVRLEEWNRMNATFDAIGGYFVEDIADTSGELPEMVRRAFVSPRFEDVWRIPPFMGRAFVDAEHLPGGPPAVIVSERYWRRRLAASPGVIGTTVRLGTASIPIVGVMPASFQFPDRKVDLWQPVAITEKLAQTRDATWYTGIGRLKPGVTIEQAHGNLAAVQAELARRFPNTDRTIGVSLQPFKAMTIGDVGSSLWLLFGAVSVLLLITCTNVAALLLSRATQRRQEVGVRLALGATRASIVGQMLVETTLLAAAGAVLGLLAAAATSSAFAFAAGEIPRLDEIALDWRIAMYTLAITLIATLFSGVLPAVRASRSGAGATSGATRAQVSGRNALQWILVGAQVAMSVTLLAGAALLVRSFQEVSRVERGFDSAHVLTFRISGSWAETVDYLRLRQRIDDTIAHLSAMPGVTGAATTAFLPGLPSQYESTFRLLEGADQAAAQLASESRFVSPEYFATMRIPVLEGEVCRRQTSGGPAELMVNRAFVARHLSSPPTAIGLHLLTGSSSAPAGRIAGIVVDARERGLDREPGPLVYSCTSAPNPMPFFLVRTAGDPAAAAPALRQGMKAFAPLRAMYDVVPLEDRLASAFVENRLRTTLLALFAATALALSTVGLYGTLSYAVTIRRREIGLRLALGAGRAVIVRQVLGQGLAVAAIAAGCGLTAALGAARVLSSMLYGVSPADPLTLTSVVALVLGVAAVAALIPAVRAAWIEPSRALKQES